MNGFAEEIRTLAEHFSAQAFIILHSAFFIHHEL